MDKKTMQEHLTNIESNNEIGFVDSMNKFKLECEIVNYGKTFLNGPKAVKGFACDNPENSLYRMLQFYKLHFNKKSPNIICFYGANPYISEIAQFLGIKIKWVDSTL